MPQRKPRMPWFTKVFHAEYLASDRLINTSERTQEQVEFLERVLNLRPGSKILDLACGYGRHVIELACRGYAVTGLDINPFFLHEAEKETKFPGVNVELVRGDMRHVCFQEQTFDAVINMYTSFGYFKTQEEDQEVLNGVYGILRPGGKFVIDTVNKDEVVLHIAGQRSARQRLALSPEGFSIWYQKVKFHEDGTAKEASCKIRIYSAPDLIAMCRKAGFRPSEKTHTHFGEISAQDSPRSILVMFKD